MPLTLALVFHFNQHIREHARLASQVCYRGLLHLLRARPEVKANIHISGTLLHALGWLDPEPLELVREGLADGQFELLGSTYAQNVPYASDDERLKHHFNFAAWFGRSRGLHACLDCIVQGGGDYLAYTEDAEAMGQWGYHQGIDPQQTWERLGHALDDLASRPDLKFGLLSQAPEPVAERSSIAEGCARWMDASLQQPGRPYHEDGYRDWFDYNARSPKLARTRGLYSGIRSKLRDRSESSPEERSPGPGEQALPPLATNARAAGFRTAPVLILQRRPQKTRLPGWAATCPAGSGRAKLSLSPCPCARCAYLERPTVFRHNAEAWSTSCAWTTLPCCGRAGKPWTSQPIAASRR